MKHMFGKFGFVHRRLWRENRLYQASLLCGPAPLLGCVVAAGLWAAGIGGLMQRYGTQPSWAIPQKVDLWNTSGGTPQAVKPAEPLPKLDEAGHLIGYKTGWRMTTGKLDVRPGYNVNIDGKPLTAFSLDDSSLDMARIMAEGPKLPLYAGEGGGLFVVRTAGIYTLTLRFDRPAAQPADCLERLGFGPHRIISNVDTDVIRDVSKTFNSARFDLQPGLYSIAWAFSCWHDQAVTAPGRLTLLVGHPGETASLPARPDDIVQRDAIKPLN
jgi:hypothetical protein